MTVDSTHSTPRSPSDPIELFVPGRICLFGEHSDWAGGFRAENPSIPVGKCLIAGTNQGLLARVYTKYDGHLHLQSRLDHDEELAIDITTEEDLLAEATSNSLWSYICGTYYQMRKAHPDVIHGLVLDNYRTTLPVKKGLSSSAAVCVLTARALNQIYDLGLTKRDEMGFAYLGETMTPSKCGRMDQGCAYGNVPILMTFDGDDLHVDDQVDIGGPIHLLLVDLCASKNTPAILMDLRQAYPEATCSVTRGVQALLGQINHDIMNQALDALKRGCPRAVGECMVKAQQLFDEYAIPASPDNLTSPVLHQLLECPTLQQYVYGGKGVGSQGDGSAQFVAKSVEDRDKAMQFIQDEYGMTCLPLTIGE